jgi:AAA+ superfamily predicted ATPase
VGDQGDEMLLRYRLTEAAGEFLDRHHLSEIALRLDTSPGGADARPTALVSPAASADTLSIEDRASHYAPVDPEYEFSFLVLPEETVSQVMLAVSTIQLTPLLFDDWGLRQVEPHPSVAMSLHGKPGTGKTATAHAVAAMLGRKIIASKYSQIESKYHGEGPKNLDALFYAAQQHNAVLFIDEADSLMSRRFEVTSHGSEEAVNAMRSALFMLLDKHEGLVIFASNFVRSYDTAFDTRVRHVHIPDPDRAARAAIWRNHLPSKLPGASEVDVAELAEIEGLCGREIRRAVIDAATAVAIAGRERVSQEDLAGAAREVLRSKQVARPDSETGKPAGPEVAGPIRDAVTKRSAVAE